MATRQTSVKIPKNVRVNRSGKDAVVPSVKGIRTIIPSTLGIADRARFGKYVKAADALVHGLDAVIKIRNSDEAQQDPELKALANDPRLAKAIDRAINKLAAGVDSLVRSYNEEATDDPEALAAGSGTNIVNRPTAGDPTAVSGQDGITHVYTADQALRIERARKAAFNLATALNPARVALGMADDPATSYDCVLNAK